MIKYCCDSGTATSLDRSIPKNQRRTLTYHSEKLWYFEADKQPSVFKDDIYGSFQDIVNEFQQKFRQFLPTGFDISPYLMVINGWEWG